MLIHLETGCHSSPWNAPLIQFALMIFTRHNPVDYGILACETGPITCGCPGKSFPQVSALCQHLESGACDIPMRGGYVVEMLINMLETGEWIWQYDRGEKILAYDLHNAVKRWGNRLYR